MARRGPAPHARCMHVHATLAPVPAIQIRNVPDDVHAKLKARAAARGQSLSEYALAELRQSSEQLTLEELFARIDALADGDRPIADPEETVAIIHEGRVEP